MRLFEICDEAECSPGSGPKDDGSWLAARHRDRTGSDLTAADVRRAWKEWDESPSYHYKTIRLPLPEREE